MGLFGFRRTLPLPPRPEPVIPIAITPIDVTKRYDVYCGVTGEERMYENICFVGIRTFERITEYSSGIIGGYLEIETADNSRLLIPMYGIQLICEHGTQPAFQVLRRWSC
jgi:hypothetical protein